MHQPLLLMTHQHHCTLCTLLDAQCDKQDHYHLEISKETRTAATTVHGNLQLNCSNKRTEAPDLMLGHMASLRAALHEHAQHHSRPILILHKQYTVHTVTSCASTEAITCSPHMHTSLLTHPLMQWATPCRHVSG